MSDSYCFAFKAETSPGGDYLIQLTLRDLLRRTTTCYGGPGQDPIAVGLEILSLADLIASFKFHYSVIKRTTGIDLRSRDCSIDLGDLAKQAFDLPCNTMDAWAERLQYRRARFNGAPKWCIEAERRCVADVVQLLEPLYLILMAENAR